MEYQKIINLLDSAPNQLFKFRTKNWVEINNDSHETYNSVSQIRFKTSMVKSSLCDYSDACILLKETITITGRGADLATRQRDERNKEVIFKNCASFTKCITQINNTELYNAQEIDVVMPMYNLI